MMGIKDFFIDLFSAQFVGVPDVTPNSALALDMITSSELRG